MKITCGLCCIVFKKEIKDTKKNSIFEKILHIGGAVSTPYTKGDATAIGKGLWGTRKGDFTKVLESANVEPKFAGMAGGILNIVTDPAMLISGGAGEIARGRGFDE